LKDVNNVDVNNKRENEVISEEQLKKQKKWEKKKYSSSWAKQLLVLSHRAAVHLWRDPILLKAHGIM
jgi:hypothetical protein